MITIIVPIRWYIVKISPKSKVAYIAVAMGVGDTKIDALFTSIYCMHLYQKNNPFPYTGFSGCKKIKLIIDKIILIIIKYYIYTFYCICITVLKSLKSKIIVIHQTMEEEYEIFERSR